MITDRQKVFIKDVLQNLAPNSGASVDYGSGVLVGVVSTIMAIESCMWIDAMKIVRECAPNNYRIECFPESWR